MVICISFYFQLCGLHPLNGLAYHVFSCRYVSSDLATDVIINVGEVKFYLHKVWCSFYAFPSSGLN